MDRLLLLIAGCALLWSLESVMPLRRYAGGGVRRAMANVALTAIVLLTNLALAFVAATASSFVVTRQIGILHLLNIPAWLGAIAGIAALDLSAYVAHVAMHKSALGWRFHRVHHSDERVDVTTAFRQHPGETVWRVVWQLPAIVAFGLPLWIVVLYLTFSSLNAQLEHANVRVRESIDGWFRTLFVTPNMHKVHHSRNQAETDSNYANILSIWDRLFGTYTHPAGLDALRYGLDGLDDRETQTLRGLLALPF
jgi:sterol desaturase/sphingolipid hydroxylase (fatty acid hydroxylase superfamily)